MADGLICRMSLNSMDAKNRYRANTSVPDAVGAERVSNNYRRRQVRGGAVSGRRLVRLLGLPRLRKEVPNRHEHGRYHWSNHKTVQPKE